LLKNLWLKIRQKNHWTSVPHLQIFFTRVEACFEEITVQVRRCKWYHTFLKTGADRNGRGVKV
jgi:hypothetical protein